VRIPTQPCAWAACQAASDAASDAACSSLWPHTAQQLHSRARTPITTTLTRGLSRPRGTGSGGDSVGEGRHTQPPTLPHEHERAAPQNIPVEAISTFCKLKCPSSPCNETMGFPDKFSVCKSLCSHTQTSHDRQIRVSYVVAVEGVEGNPFYAFYKKPQCTARHAQGPCARTADERPHLKPACPPFSLSLSVSVRHRSHTAPGQTLSLVPASARARSCGGSWGVLALVSPGGKGGGGHLS